jgi:hypothetical protein
MNRGILGQVEAVTAGRTLDPASLSEAERIDALVALQRFTAWAEAQAVRILARMDTGSELDRDLAATEIGVALREPPATVYDRLRTATDLTSRLPATLQLLDAGEVSYRHAKILVDAVRPLPDQIAAKIEQEVFGRAARQSSAAFYRSVHKAVLAHDPRRAQQRHKDAVAGRRVCFRPVADGMAELWALLPADGAAVLRARLDAEASRKEAGDDRTLDQRRADALVALAEQGLLDGEVPSQHGRKPVIQVTIPASTLLGLDNQPGELDGHGPIPAELARRLAADPTCTWHRLLTDPDGRLVDYSQPGYRPDRVLTEFLLARDRTCRFPGCTRQARLTDIDHRLPWPDGPTAASNCECLCEHHHRLKHTTGWTVTGNPNGTLTWRSPTGHEYQAEPHDYG